MSSLSYFLKFHFSYDLCVCVLSIFKFHKSVIFLLQKAFRNWSQKKSLVIIQFLEIQAPKHRLMQLMEVEGGHDIDKLESASSPPLYKSLLIGLG